jgi:hypothetical protein
VTRITAREAEAAMRMFVRGLDAGDRALVRHANAALLAYLAQFAGARRVEEVEWLCGRVVREMGDDSSSVQLWRRRAKQRGSGAPGGGAVGATV